MRGKRKVLDFFPVTTSKAVFLEGTNKSIDDALKSGEVAFTSTIIKYIDCSKLLGINNIDFSLTQRGSTFDIDLDYKKLLKRNNSTPLKDYYISITRGSDSSGDGTYEKPYKTLSKIYSNTDIKTVYLEEGIYSRNEITNVFESMSFVHLKAMEEQKVILFNGDKASKYSFTNNDGIFKTDRTGITRVLDLDKYDERGYVKEYVKVSNESELKNHEYSFCYGTDSKLCIYDKDGSIPDSVYLEMEMSIGTSKGLLYLEDIEVIGGVGILIQNKDTTCILKNCKISYTYNTNNGLNVFSGNVISINSTCLMCGADGFNYHGKNGISGYAIEINCKGMSNGINNSTNTNNGSTSHEDYKVVRVNGTYINNNGINIADVNNTVSYNYGCYMSGATGQEIDFYSDKICYLFNSVLTSTNPIKTPEGISNEIKECIIK